MRQPLWWGRFLAGAASTLNVGLHLWLTPMHLREMFYVGVLFCIGNAALVLAALLLLAPRGAPLGWTLLVATAVIELTLYLASRTVGLPAGYVESWTGEPEDVLGLVALVSDVALIASAALALRVRRFSGGVSLFEAGTPDVALRISWHPPSLHAHRSSEGRDRRTSRVSHGRKAAASIETPRTRRTELDALN